MRDASSPLKLSQDGGPQVTNKQALDRHLASKTRPVKSCEVINGAVRGSLAAIRVRCAQRHSARVERPTPALSPTKLRGLGSCFSRCSARSLRLLPRCVSSVDSLTPMIGHALGQRFGGLCLLSASLSWEGGAPSSALLAKARLGEAVDRDR